MLYLRRHADLESVIYQKDFFLKKNVIFLFIDAEVIWKWKFMKF